MIKQLLISRQFFNQRVIHTLYFRLNILILYDQ